jgi:hypothetical protein
MKNKNLFIICFMMTALFVVTKNVDAFGMVAECGNLICESSEDSTTCPFDCNPCGDGTCDVSIGETPLTCSADCNGPVCGDGTCDASEDYKTCPLDCTTLPQPQPDPGKPSPFCEDVMINVGEKTTCSIKVENIETFPLTQVVAEVTIPDKITKVDNTDSWNCSSTIDGVKCQKTYSPYLVMGEIEYLELTLTTDTEGKYSLGTVITGSGRQYNRVTYNTTKSITVTDSTPVTAKAKDDNAMQFGDFGGCNTTITIRVADNDTLCSSGKTTFNFYNINKNATVHSTNINEGEINLTVTVGHLFDYDILCNGVTIDTASAGCMAS